MGGIVGVVLGWIGGVTAIATAIGAVVLKVVENRLATRLEAFKGALATEAERHRHELQRETMKAQLSANQLNVIYPQLFAKLRRADGAIGGLVGLRYGPSYDGYSRDDIVETLESMKLPGEYRDRVLSHFDRVRDEGIRELKRVSRDVESERARVTHTRARNYLILKSLFVSPEVKKLGHGILKDLWKAWTLVQAGAAPRTRGTDYDKIGTALDSATKQLDELEELMGRELRVR